MYNNASKYIHKSIKGRGIISNVELDESILVNCDITMEKNIVNDIGSIDKRVRTIYTGNLNVSNITSNNISTINESVSNLVVSKETCGDAIITNMSSSNTYLFENTYINDTIASQYIRKQFSVDGQTWITPELTYRTTPLSYEPTNGSFDFHTSDEHFEFNNVSQNLETKINVESGLNHSQPTNKLSLDLSSDAPIVVSAGHVSIDIDTTRNSLAVVNGRLDGNYGIVAPIELLEPSTLESRGSPSFGLNLYDNNTLLITQGGLSGNYRGTGGINVVMGMVSVSHNNTILQSSGILRINDNQTFASVFVSNGNFNVISTGTIINSGTIQSTYITTGNLRVSRTTIGQVLATNICSGSFNITATLPLSFSQANVNINLDGETVSVNSSGNLYAISTSATVPNIQSVSPLTTSLNSVGNIKSIGISLGSSLTASNGSLITNISSTSPGLLIDNVIGTISYYQRDTANTFLTNYITSSNATLTNTTIDNLIVNTLASISNVRVSRITGGQILANNISSANLVSSNGSFINVSSSNYNIVATNGLSMAGSSIGILYDNTLSVSNGNLHCNLLSTGANISVSSPLNSLLNTANNVKTISLSYGSSLIETSGKLITNLSSTSAGMSIDNALGSISYYQRDTANTFITNSMTSGNVYANTYSNLPTSYANLLITNITNSNILSGTVKSTLVSCGTLRTANIVSTNVSSSNYNITGVNPIKFGGNTVGCSVDNSTIKIGASGLEGGYIAGAKITISGNSIALSTEGQQDVQDAQTTADTANTLADTANTLAGEANALAGTANALAGSAMGVASSAMAGVGAIGGELALVTAAAGEALALAGAVGAGMALASVISMLFGTAKTVSDGTNESVLITTGNYDIQVLKSSVSDITDFLGGSNFTLGNVLSNSNGSFQNATITNIISSMISAGSLKVTNSTLPNIYSTNITCGGITFPTTGVGIPSASVGNKIILYNSGDNYSVGIETKNIWNKVPQGNGYKWYEGTNANMRYTNGNLLVSSGVSTNNLIAKSGTFGNIYAGNYLNLPDTIYTQANIAVSTPLVSSLNTVNNVQTIGLSYGSSIVKVSNGSIQTNLSSTTPNLLINNTTGTINYIQPNTFGNVTIGNLYASTLPKST